MSLIGRLLDWARGARGAVPREPRRVRRERARERVRGTGGDPWPAAERLDEPLPNVRGEDVTPGTPGGRIGFG